MADKGIARIFTKPDGHLELIGEIFPEALSADMTDAALGRVANSSGKARHKYEPHMTQARQGAISFAREIADWLTDAEAADTFDRLVLVAAPRTLGDLRNVMSKQLQSRIAAEVDKDLTNLDETALYKALDDIVWF